MGHKWPKKGQNGPKRGHFWTPKMSHIWRSIRPKTRWYVILNGSGKNRNSEKTVYFWWNHLKHRKNPVISENNEIYYINEPSLFMGLVKYCPEMVQKGVKKWSKRGQKVGFWHLSNHLFFSSEINRKKSGIAYQMIQDLGVKNGPKSGQKPEKSLFFTVPGPELGHFWETFKGACSRFDKNNRYFRGPKMGPFFDHFWPLFWQNRPLFPINVFLTKIGKKCKKWSKSVILVVGRSTPFEKVKKSDFLRGPKNWLTFWSKCWNVFSGKSGFINSPTAYDFHDFGPCSNRPKNDPFLGQKMTLFWTPQKMEVVKELLYPPFFGGLSNYGFEQL